VGRGRSSDALPTFTESTGLSEDAVTVGPNTGFFVSYKEESFFFRMGGVCLRLCPGTSALVGTAPSRLRAHKGMNFAVREGGITIGAGVVVELLADGQAPAPRLYSPHSLYNRTPENDSGAELQARCFVRCGGWGMWILGLCLGRKLFPFFPPPANSGPRPA